jgi:membrane-anchored protein YejM (alkaline phosphatase superfamily)
VDSLVTALPPGRFLRRPALFWFWLHVPVTMAIYAPAIATTLPSVPESYRPALVVSYVVQAAFLLTLLYVVTWPLSFSAQVYSNAVPIVSGAAMVAQFVDSQLYQAVGFHMNGLFFRVLWQPGALREVGVPVPEVLLLAVLFAVWMVADATVGRRFLLRLATERRAVTWAGAMLAVVLVERLSSAALIFNGGLAVDAAEQVLPLQPPMRLNGQMALLTGRRARIDSIPAPTLQGPVRLPNEIDPASVRFTRTPDILFILIESLRADFLDPETMPRLWKRAQGGTVFEHHYATSSSTHYALFSLFYGLNGHKFEAVVGSGRGPLLLGALKANGYRSRFIAASSVDWMELAQFAFRDVKEDLETHLTGDGELRDADMLARADRFVSAGGEQPQFLFLFFVGTHFRYSYPARSARFAPCWDGSGTYRAAHLYPALVRERARNAAYEVDWKLDEFLHDYEAKRGRKPLVIVTGDHGEAFGERGRIGHTSNVTDAQIHVPMVILGDSRPPSRRQEVTSHIDVVPTLLSLLGDDRPSQTYSDGMSMFSAPPDRFVLATVGWEPRFAVIGRDLKVTFFAYDAALGGVEVTDPSDRPLSDGASRFSAQAPRILRAFRDSRTTSADR